MNVNIDRYEDEIKTLQAENDTLRESVAGNQSLQDTIYSLQGQLDDRIREFYERRNEMEATLRQYSDRYVTDVNAAEERVAELEDQLEREREECKEENGRLALEVDSLNNVRSRIEQSLREEKEKCLEEVQRAIDGERELSKREARAYEEKLAELNYKLLVCEETREELEKIKAGGNMSEVKMSKKQLKKAQKKLEKAI
jgi:chromosome segregation ATPase